MNCCINCHIQATAHNKLLGANSNFSALICDTCVPLVTKLWAEQGPVIELILEEFTRRGIEWDPALTVTNWGIDNNPYHFEFGLDHLGGAKRCGMIFGAKVIVTNGEFESCFNCGDPNFAKNIVDMYIP